MSVVVTHLNADSTFLLTFYVGPCPGTDSSKADFCILIDPWLSGDLVLNPFATTAHKIPASISHLSELPEPDLLIISQPYQDHCHKETLVQVAPASKSIVAAVPKAAALIRKWDHFNPVKVSEMPVYDPKRKTSVSRFFTAPLLSPGGEPGEVTLAYVPRKADKNGYHNAICITYLPPTARKTLTLERPPCLSIIYSPHGVQVSDIAPYMEKYLRLQGVLSPTLLLHSFTRVVLPWYMGAGKMLYGADNGIALAKYLRPRIWLSAHDEDKVRQGAILRKIQEVPKTVEEVGKLLCPDPNYQSQGDDSRMDAVKWKEAGRWVCEVKALASGESMNINSDG